MGAWEHSRHLSVIRACIIGLGLLHAWAGRYTVNADGISYMDMAVAIGRGHWGEAINAYWSPMYAVILGLLFRVVRPLPAHEAAVAHGLNFLVFLMAFASFHFFWSSLIVRRGDGERPSPADKNALPEWAMWTLGYGLFTWASLRLVTVQRVGPDLWLTAWLYLAAGLLARIRQGRNDARAFAMLGLVLALGYLTKTIMCVLMPVFLLIAWRVEPQRRNAWRRTLVAFAVFVGVAGPWIATLSVKKGRFTTGDCGRINYALFVSASNPAYSWHDLEGDNPLFGWRGQIAGLGTPVHGKQLLHVHPTLELFAGPVGGSYPFWYDPSYWYEGVKMPWNLSGQWRAFADSMAALRDLARENWPLPVAILLVAIGLASPRLSLYHLAWYWWILLPALVCGCLFAMIVIVPRHVAGAIVLIGSVMLVSIRLRSDNGGRWRGRGHRFWQSLTGGMGKRIFFRLPVATTAGATGKRSTPCPCHPFSCVPRSLATPRWRGHVAGGLILAGLVWPIVAGSTGALRQAATDLRWRMDTCPNPAGRIADGMARLGIEPGDRVGHIGKALKDWSYWASVARVQIIAEVRPGAQFWALDTLDQQRLIEQMRQAGGIKAVVARHVPAEAIAAGWREVGHTGFFVLKVLPNLSLTPRLGKLPPA